MAAYLWNALELIFGGLGVVGLVHALALLLFTFENTRFFRSRLRSRVPTDYTPRVQLFMPCKGIEPSFEDGVEALLGLDYPYYDITFVVESADDPAYARLQALLTGPQCVQTRVLVAGPAHDCGQKVHNLLTATAQLAPPTEVVAFVDSDTVLDPHWLRRLVNPLRDEGFAAVTGYRWFLAGAEDRAAAVLSALNATVAFTLGNHRWNQVWGGSWAVRRPTFERLLRDGTWQGALTEDLPVGRMVRRLRRRVAFEPNCLVASPIRGSWAGLVEFARRQYLITRFYDPALWWFALLTTALSQGVFWGAAVCVLLNWAGGRPAVLAAALAASLYGVNSARALLRHAAAAGRFPRRRDCLRRAAWIDVLAHPLLGLGHLFLLAASACGRVVAWRSIRYRLYGPHRTEILSRPEAADAGVFNPACREAA